MKITKITASFTICLAVLVSLALWIACSQPSTNPPPSPNPPNSQPLPSNYPLSLKVSSTTFEEGKPLPLKYSCDGDNVSPQISWTAGPPETRFYVLLMEDVDTPDRFAHWIVYNIRSTVTEMHEGISTNGILKTGSIQGRNDMGKLGYFGPCPPTSATHHYVFSIYAVDNYLQMASARIGTVKEHINGHTLAEGKLTGIYKR